MKTTKAQRDMLREVYERTHESCKWVGPGLNPQPVMVDLIDDVTELERKLAICVGALEFYAGGEFSDIDVDIFDYINFDRKTFDAEKLCSKARQALASIQAEGGWGMSKLLCEECDWCGERTKVLTAPNPFDTQDDISGCPQCKCVNSTVSACDVDGCNKESTCGTPTKDGYRRTCGKHIPAPTSPVDETESSGI